MIYLFIYLYIAAFAYTLAGLHGMLTDRIGFLPRLGSFWIGIHYSKYCKRWCINLLPCLTIWVGEPPTITKM